jgi:deoxyhypusine synthase
MSNNWQHLANPYGNGIKVFLNDIAGSTTVVNNEEILDRIGRVIVTESDYKQFGKLVVSIYEVAHRRALEQITKHQGVLERHGLRINISTETPEKSGEKIFKDHDDENSG